MKDTKKNFFKESFYATGFILVSVYLLSLIEFNSDLLNPIAKAFGDFKLTDVVFSQIRENPEYDDKIVMVNIGNQPREVVAEIINIINSDDPKIIGIDAFFRKPNRDANVDTSLARAFSKVKNLVLVTELHENIEAKKIDSMSTSHPMFMKYAMPGFADMITEGKDVFKTSRDCFIKETAPKTIGSYEKTISLTIDTLINGEKQTYKKDSVIIVTNYKDTTYYSFPVKMASIYDPGKVKKLLDRGMDTEIINFQGNIDPRQEGVTSNSKIVFSALDWYQVLDKEFEPGWFKDKIVVMGFMGDYIGERTLIDIFFTPLNSNYIGKANPDMFGVVVHANILSMILKGEFIDEMPFWINSLISIVMVFLNVWFFTYLYFKTEEWYDGLSLVITLAEIAVLMIIVVVIFDRYNYKIDVTLVSVALFLTGNLIEIYFGIVMPTVLRMSNKVKNLTKKVPIFTKN